MEKSEFSLLFSRIELGPVTLPDRIMFAPHGQALASQDNLPTERQVHYFAKSAKGTRLIVLGGSLIMRNCVGFPFRNLVCDERSIPGYERIAEAIHDDGEKVLCPVVAPVKTIPMVAHLMRFVEAARGFFEAPGL